MSRRHSSITYGTNHDQSLAYRAFNSLTKRTGQIRFFKISSGGNVYDSNAKLFPMFEYPSQSTVNVFIRNVSPFADLYEDQIRLGSETAIKTFRQVTISCRDHRSHHSMPAGNVSCLQRGWIFGCIEDAVVSKDAIDWSGQVRMCIEPGIEECNSDPFSREALIGIHAQGRWQHEACLLEDCSVRIDLALRSLKYLQTLNTNRGRFPSRQIGFDKLP